MDFSAEKIERTLVLFYKNAQVQSESNEYLMLAQMSHEAWSFPWELLLPHKIQEVQFFGASTLHLKISRFWKELPPDQFQTLRMKLLETIVNYSAGPKIILTRLCVALSAFIIRTVSDSWPNAVTDIISTLHSQNLPNLHPKQAVTVLLELLTVLPEEFQTIHLPQSQRGIVRSVLQTSLQQVLAIIQDIVFKIPSSGADSLTYDLSQMTLKCFASWSQLDAVVLEFEPLLDGIIALSHQPDLCQSALEALGHVVTHPDSHKYPNSVLRIINKLVFSLKSIIDKALQEKDMDICCSAYGLAVSVGETHSRLLLETALDANKPDHQNTVMKLIELILQCSGTPGQFPTDEICSEQTFGFWYIFQDDIVASDAHKYQSYLLMFHSVFLSLVDTYLVKVRFPPDEEYSQWQADEKESFRCYRQDIGDSFMYCYSVLRESMLASLMSHLQIASQTAAQTNPSQWQYLEACLYGFQSVSESIELDDNNYLQQFFAILPQLPLQHVRIISTTMDTIGAYAEWINVHSQVLSQVIPLLLLGLRNADMSQAATMALKDISRDCQPSMKPYAENILEAGREALTKNELRDRERVRLMSTIGQVLSIMPMEFIMPYLDSILTPLVQQFRSLLNQPASGANKSTTILYLNVLSVLFSTLDIKRRPGLEESPSEAVVNPNSQATQPVLLILTQLMPVFEAVGTKWSFDEVVMEVLCEALKRGVATLLDDCRPLVPSILQLVSQFYLSQPHNTSSLDLAKQLLLLFGSDAMLRPQLGSLFSQITSHTMNLCQKDLRTHTVVAEVYFQLLAQLMKKIPSIFDHCANLLPIVFQCAIAALGLPEKTTVKATSGFIVELINKSRDNPVMLDIVNSQGEALVGQVLKVIGGSSPRSVLEHMPDILMALNKKYFDNLCRWMSAFIQQDGYPSPKVTAQQKEEFIRTVLKERTNKRKLKEVVTEFGLQCRGLFGTQFGAESFTSP